MKCPPGNTWCLWIWWEIQWILPAPSRFFFWGRVQTFSHTQIHYKKKTISEAQEPQLPRAAAPEQHPKPSCDCQPRRAPLLSSNPQEFYRFLQAGPAKQLLLTSSGFALFLTHLCFPRCPCNYTWKATAVPATHWEPEQANPIHLRRGCLFPTYTVIIHKCSQVGVAPCGSCFIIQAGRGSKGCPIHPAPVRAAQPLLCCAHHPRAEQESRALDSLHSIATWETAMEIKQSEITDTSRHEVSFHWLSVFSQECTVSTQVNNASTAFQMVSHPEWLTTSMNCRTFAPTNYLKSEQLITNRAVWLNGRHFSFNQFCYSMGNVKSNR